ncbi:LLM class flavin-dependent oxidoreductase [Nocardiopsis terrae]
MAHGRPEHVAVFAKIVRRTGAKRLWQGQSLVFDSHHLASWLAGAGLSVPLGFGVSLMPMRSPYQAALEARSAALTTGQTVVAGYGPGAVATQRSLMGRPYSSQLDASREYARLVRALLSGELARSSGPHFDLTASLVPVPAPPPAVEVGLGVLRKRMARVAGEVADRAITWMASADHLGDTLVPAMRSAPRDLDRPVRVTAVVPVALAGEGRDPALLASASCGQHVQHEHYQEALGQAGVRVDGDGGAADAARLIDSGVFLHGSTSDIHEGLLRFAEAGVDEVVLNTTGVAQVHGPKAAAHDLLELLRNLPGGVPLPRTPGSGAVDAPSVHPTLTESGIL